MNIGIQQGGVDTAVPEAMRVSTYERTQLFLSPEENEMVANAYQLLDPTDPKYTETIVNYPKIEAEPLYILNELEPEKSKEIILFVSSTLSVVDPGAAFVQLVPGSNKAAAI